MGEQAIPMDAAAVWQAGDDAAGSYCTRRHRTRCRGQSSATHYDFKRAVTRKSRPCQGTLRVLIKQIAA